MAGGSLHDAGQDAMVSWSVRPPGNKGDTTMSNRFKFLVAAASAAALSLMLANPAIAAPPASKASKLGGAWIAKVVDGPGQWTYMLAADPSGRHAAGHGSIDVGFYVPGLSELSDENSPILIDMVMTGPDRGTFNSVWYGLGKVSGGMTTTEVVYIGIDWGEFRFVATGKTEVTHNIEFYLPYQDADGDGLPDPGQIPVGAWQGQSLDARLGQR
jgi:hypothetical protein